MFRQAIAIGRRLFLAAGIEAVSADSGRFPKLFQGMALGLGDATRGAEAPLHAIPDRKPAGRAGVRPRLPFRFGRSRR